MRVVRIYHAGRDEAHRARERELVRSGVQLRLVVPATWPGPDDDASSEPFDVVQLDVLRPGDVNRHRYRSTAELASAIWSFAPDLLDVHEEPVSLVARQALSVAGRLPVTMYSAQNLDKRWPPPFRGYERRALARVQALYPCSRQAAAVLHAKGYQGHLQPLPLGLDGAAHFPGAQAAGGPPVLGLVGRLVPEKGLLDALDVLAALPGDARLVVVGSGPELSRGQARAAALGLEHAVQWVPWVPAVELAALYRQMHVVLVPSRGTATWVEQFGRVITEAGANGAVCVGYDSGSIAEVVQETGRVVPQGDVAALVRVVTELLEDRGAWERFREAGLARARTIDWSRVAQQQVRLYELASGMQPPQGPAARRPADSEWGAPARTALSSRPFASPVLRSSDRAHRVAEALDRAAARRRA